MSKTSSKSSPVIASPLSILFLIFFIKVLVQQSFALFILGKQKLATGFVSNCSSSICDTIKIYSNDPSVRYQIQEFLGATTNWIVDKGSNFLLSVPQMVIGLFISFVSMYYFLKDGKFEPKVIGTFEQYPIRLAWAATIHKCQGQTFEKAIVDFDSGAFAHGMTYVALSRVKSLDGLNLIRPIKSSDIKFDDRIYKFQNTVELFN
mgnify:CR=1 FL=1